MEMNIHIRKLPGSNIEQELVLYSDHKAAMEEEAKMRATILAEMKQDKEKIAALEKELSEQDKVDVFTQEIYSDQRKQIAVLTKFKEAVGKDRCSDCPFLNDAEGMSQQIAALTAEVAEWKRVAAAQAALHDESSRERKAGYLLPGSTKREWLIGAEWLEGKEGEQ